ncbi:hypothetical protein AB0N28_27900 [Streptomyces sp. NPDC051130]|uniref:hypothetical protein n=1 Tax=Streptomyces sp. NPDC051130 TaxID=3157223 RepID=UPI003426464A
MGVPPYAVDGVAESVGAALALPGSVDRNHGVGRGAGGHDGGDGRGGVRPQVRTFPGRSVEAPEQVEGDGQQQREDGDGSRAVIHRVSRRRTDHVHKVARGTREVTWDPLPATRAREAAGEGAAPRTVGRNPPA